MFVWFKRGDLTKSVLWKTVAFVDVISAIYSIERSQLWNCSIVQINLLIRAVCRRMMNVCKCLLADEGAVLQMRKKWKGSYETHVIDTDYVYYIQCLSIENVSDFTLHIQIAIYVHKFWRFAQCHEEIFNRKIHSTLQPLILRCVRHFLWNVFSYLVFEFAIRSMNQCHLWPGSERKNSVPKMKNHKAQHSHACQLINHINHIEMSMNVQ